jgi:uncharacterized membrane protein YkoI
MTDGLRKTVTSVAAVAAFALGGAAVAGAVSKGGSGAQQGTTSAQGSGSGSSRGAPGPGGIPGGPLPRRSDEQLLTGDTAAKVRAAALAAVSGGTIERVETDADGHAPYEAHMVKADGSRVTVYVNSSFDVVGQEAGPPA